MCRHEFRGIGTYRKDTYELKNSGFNQIIGPWYAEFVCHKCGLYKEKRIKYK